MGHLVAGSVSSSGPLFAKLDFQEYLQVVMDALDWTHIEGCNAAWNDALTTVEEMVTMEVFLMLYLYMVTLIHGMPWVSLKICTKELLPYTSMAHLIVLTCIQVRLVIQKVLMKLRSELVN